MKTFWQEFLDGSEWWVTVDGRVYAFPFQWGWIHLDALQRDVIFTHPQLQNEQL